jgi:hypothetical protein
MRIGTPALRNTSGNPLRRLINVAEQDQLTDGA